MWRNSGMLITAHRFLESLYNENGDQVVIHADTEWRLVRLRKLLLEALNDEERTGRRSDCLAG